MTRSGSPVSGRVRPRHGRAVLVAAGLALTAAATSLAPVREEPLLVGRPGDARRVDGMSSPAEHLGRSGRWTRGDGLLSFPRLDVPATISLHLAPSDDRAPDAIEVILDQVHVHRRTLDAGMNVVRVWMDSDVVWRGRPDDATSVVRIRSATSEATRGVFIEKVVMTTGGGRALSRTPMRTWIGLTLGFLGVIAFGWLAVRDLAQIVSSPPGAVREHGHEGSVEAGRPDEVIAAGRGWLACAALTVLAVAGAVVFRTSVLTHLGGVLAACWGGAAALWMASGRPGGAVAAWSTPRVAVLFACVALALVGLLLPDAIAHGRVLSQADMLFEFFPWRSHAPLDHRPFDRPPLGDVPMLVYPFAALTQARFWEGAFPLWTSAIAAGQPFFGTYQSALLSPFTWLLAVVPLPQATVVIAVARLLVAGVGMFLFLRAIRLSRWASTFGGVAYLLNPFSVVWLEHPLAGVPPWLPWMLLAAERVPAADGRHRRAWAVAALSLTTALVFVGGHPHTSLFVAALGAGYAVTRAWCSTDRRRAVPAALGALTLGAALTAVQVLPFLEYLSLSRAVSLRTGHDLNPFFAPASTLITAIVPNFLGHHGAGNFAGPTNYLEQQAYPGVAVWLLAVVGVVNHARRWQTWFFVVASLLAMLVMYAAPGVHQLVSSLPLVSAASLPRLACVTMASLAVLASFGLESVLSGSRTETIVKRQRWRTTVLMSFGAGALALLIVATLRARAEFLEANALTEFATRWSALAVWFSLGVVVLSVARVHRGLGRSAAGLGLTGLLALDLLLFGRGFHDTTRPERVFPLVPEISLVQNDRDLFRVLGLRHALTPNAAMVYGLQDVRGYDGLSVARYADLLDVVLRGEGFLHVGVGVTSPLIDLLNVKYVFSVPNDRPPDGWFTQVSDGEAPVYRNNRVLPRAFLVDGYAVRDGNDARRTLRDGLVDPRRVVLLEGELTPDERPVAALSLEGVGTATVAHYGDHRVEIRTDAPARRLLVLTDAHYPGWRVSVDGRPVTLHRANFAFRAVSVPAGAHVVVFEYRPASVRVGLAVSSAASLVIGSLLLATRRRGGSGHA